MVENSASQECLKVDGTAVEKKIRIFIAGHRGMVGAALVRNLEFQPWAEIYICSRDKLDLRNTDVVCDYFKTNGITHVYLAAAKVGGIHANNSFPAEFIDENLAIELSVIGAAYRSSIKRVLFLGSSCIYPRDAIQPMTESALLTGPLEPTNEPYAIAKIAGIKLCESYNRQYGTDFRSVMPTNLYGAGDNYHPNNSHVVPALINRFHKAKTERLDKVVVWGTGRVRREFLHVDDLAAACVFVMNVPKPKWENAISSQCSHVNIGIGKDCTIRELAESIAQTVGFDGQIEWDSSKPDGTPRKLLDVSKINELGWQASTSLHIGLQKTYESFTDSLGSGTLRQ